MERDTFHPVGLLMIWFNRPDILTLYVLLSPKAMLSYPSGDRPSISNSTLMVLGTDIWVPSTRVNITL